MTGEFLRGEGGENVPGERGSAVVHRLKGRCEWYRGWRGQYKRQTDRGIVVLCVRACVPLLVAKGGSGDRERWRRVRRISILAHGRVFAAIFGPFPFAARGAFTVHTSYSENPLRLLPPPVPLPVGPLARHPLGRPFDRCHPRVMDTQGVGDYANEAGRPSLENCE